jgi:hypothetical protein
MWHCRSSVRNCPAPTTSPAGCNFLCTIGASPRQSHGLRIRSSFVAYNGLTHRRADESTPIPLGAHPKYPPAPSGVITASLQCHSVSSSVIQCHPVSPSVIQCYPVSSSVIQCHHRAWHGDPRLAVLRREIRGSSRLRATFARRVRAKSSPLMTPRETCAHGAAGSSSSCSRGTRQVHAQVYPSPLAATHGTLRGTAGRGRHSARRWYLTKPLSEIRLTKKSRDEAQTAAVAVALTQLSEPMIFQGNGQYYLRTDDADPGDGNIAEVDICRSRSATYEDENRRNECHEEMARREHRTSVSGRRALWCDELSRSLVWIDGRAQHRRASLLITTCRPASLNRVMARARRPRSFCLYREIRGDRTNTRTPGHDTG